MSVSVVIPVFNRRDFLREAVLSVLSEEVPSLEVIVVDDGSTDGSLETIKDLPVKSIRFDQNRGISIVMNEGFRHCAGDYITVLDSDDVMAPGGLTWRWKYLNSNLHEMAVGGRPAAIIDEKGREFKEYPHLLHPKYQPPTRLSIVFLKKGGLFPLSLLLFLFRREIFKEIGFLSESLTSAHDCDFLLRVLEKYEIPIVFDPVFFRRLHQGNHSHQVGEAPRFLREKTKNEVVEVFARHGMELSGEFNLWERGYH